MSTDTPETPEDPNAAGDTGAGEEVVPEVGGSAVEAAAEAEEAAKQAAAEKEAAKKLPSIPATASIAHPVPGASPDVVLPTDSSADEDDDLDDEEIPELEIGTGSQREYDPDYQPVVRGRLDRFGIAMGTGRRKTAVARVRIKEGKGDFTVNGRPLEDFLPLERYQQMVRAPLRATETEGKFDIWVRVNGGGTTGQAGAIVLGIARALEAVDVKHHYPLSDGHFLTRDSRMVERKKYGRKKARKSFQFSKR